MSKLKLCIGAVCTALTITGCSQEEIISSVNANVQNVSDNDNGNVISETVNESERLIELAKYVILDESDDNPNATSRKWNKEIKISLNGNYTSEDATVVDSFIETLKSLNTFELNIERVFSEEESNIDIWFGTFDELTSERPDFTPSATEDISGVSRVFFSSSTQLITRSNVFINTDTSRISTIKHEILHSLGLGHSKDSSSVLFTPSVSEDLSSDDVFVIEALYSEELEANLNEEQIEDVLLTLI